MILVRMKGWGSARMFVSQCSNSLACARCKKLVLHAGSSVKLYSNLAVR